MAAASADDKRRDLAGMQICVDHQGKINDPANFLFKKLWEIELRGLPGEAGKRFRRIQAWQDYFDQAKFGRIFRLRNPLIIENPKRKAV